MSAHAWSRRWTDLADPRDERAPHGARCTVVLYEQACRHIVEKHVAPRREPWGELLSEELVQQLAELWADGADAARRTAVLERFSDRLFAAVRECLEHPLALLCTRRAGKGGRRQVQIWKLVLRCGALMVIEACPRRAVVKTCFFPRGVCRVPKSSRRWLGLLRMLVLRYAKLGEKEIVPPSPGTRADRAGKSWDEIQFVTLETWGFCTDIAGTPWRGRPAAWPAEGDDRPRRRRLLPRRLVEDEAYGYA